MVKIGLEWLTLFTGTKRESTQKQKTRAFTALFLRFMVVSSQCSTESHISSGSFPHSWSLAFSSRCARFIFGVLSPWLSMIAVGIPVTREPLGCPLDDGHLPTGGNLSLASCSNGALILDPVKSHLPPAGLTHTISLINGCCSLNVCNRV